MERGWLRIWRKIEDSSSWSRGVEYRGLIITILQKANWKTGYFMGNKINPGQFATSAINLAKELKISRQKVSRMLSNLSKDGFVSVSNVSNRYTLISIIKWDSYQQIKNNDEQPMSNHRATDEQPMSNHRAQSKKERRKEVKNNSPSKNDGDDGFEKFWDMYGKKTDSKKNCLAKWKRLSWKTRELIFERLPDYILSTPDIKYRKNPSTYLNGEFWESEVLITTDNNKKREGVSWDV